MEKNQLYCVKCIKKVVPIEENGRYKCPKCGLSIGDVVPNNEKATIQKKEEEVIISPVAGVSASLSAEHIVELSEESLVEIDNCDSYSSQTKYTYDITARFYSPLLAKEDVSETEFRLLNEFLSELKKKNDKAKILDLGCGLGKHGRFAAKYNSRFVVVGYDYSDKMIDLAKNHNDGKDKNISFKVKDIRYLAGDEKFDAAIIAFALHHFSYEDAKKCLIGLRNILKPKSSVFIITAGVENERGNLIYDTLINRLSREEKRALEHELEVFYKRYSEEILIKLIAEAGYIVGKKPEVFSDIDDTQNDEYRKMFCLTIQTKEGE